MKKKIMAVALCGALILSLTGCFGGSKIAPSKLLSYGKDSGATVYTEDEYKKIMNDNVQGTFVVNVSKDNISSFMQEGGMSLESSGVTNDQISEMTFYVKDNSGESSMAMAFAFNSKDAGEKFFSKYKETLDSFSQLGAKINEGEESGLKFMSMSMSLGESSSNMIVYTDGTNILIISGSEADANEMVSGLKLPAAVAK